MAPRALEDLVSRWWRFRFTRVSLESPPNGSDAEHHRRASLKPEDDLAVDASMPGIASEPAKWFASRWNMSRHRRYIQPTFPDGWFMLQAHTSDGEEPWELGPFQRDDFITEPDGGIAYVGQDRPIGLKVRSQDGAVLHANDGSVRRMSYTIVPVSSEAGRYR